MEIIFFIIAIIVQAITIGRGYAMQPPSEANFKAYKFGLLLTVLITITASCSGHLNGWKALYIPHISGVSEYLLLTSIFIALSSLIFISKPIYLYPWEQHPRSIAQGYHQIRYVRWIGPETTLHYETTWEGEIINEIWITNKTPKNGK
jgi:hypothetical protein